MRIGAPGSCWTARPQNRTVQAVDGTRTALRRRAGTAVVVAAPVLAGCGSGGGAAGEGLEIVAEYRLGDDSDEERRFPLTPAPGSRPEVLPAPSEVPLDDEPLPDPSPVPSVVPPEPGTDIMSGPTVAWVDDGRYLAVVTYGSSSCPAGPDAVDLISEQVLAISVAPLTAAVVCSAAMSPYVVVVEGPRGIVLTEPLVARFEYSEVTIEAVRD